MHISNAESACEQSDRSLYKAPKHISTDHPPDYAWSSMLIHDNQMLGPSTDMLGLPNNAPEATPERLIDYYKGQIHQAIDFLPTEQIQEIVKKKPDCINERGFNGIVPLHKATMRCNLGLMDYLLKNGANVNDVNNFDETSLHFAAKMGSPVVMHKLVEGGADLSAKDKNGRGVMHLAAQGGSVPALHYLCELCGLSPDVGDLNEITPLHLVCAHGHVDALEYLLQKDRARLHARDVHGNTCLHIASQYCMIEVMWQLMVQGGFTFLHDKNNEGFSALDLCEASSAARRTDAVKLLEVYGQQAKTGKIEGPHLVWYVLLLMPFTCFWLTMLIAQIFEDKGWFVLFGVAGILYFINTQMHRMNHICRWPNPIYAGMFAAGIISTNLVYFFNMFAVLHPVYPMVNITAVIATTLHLWLYYRMYTLDPGVVTQAVIKKATGLPLTIREIATGELPLDAFCPNCEFIPPARTHHCRLCRRCYDGCDHHCLFLYRCIAKNTHRLFIIFILYTAIGMISYSVMAYKYLKLAYPDIDYVGDVLYQGFADSPATFLIMLANLVSSLWLLNLVRFQVLLVSKNQTTAYQPNRGRSTLNCTQRIKNVVNFMLNKSPFAEDAKPMKA